jgi:hypothetical protein
MFKAEASLAKKFGVVKETSKLTIRKIDFIILIKAIL